jgi:hypothetical protein
MVSASNLHGPSKHTAISAGHDDMCGAEHYTACKKQLAEAARCKQENCRAVHPQLHPASTTRRLNQQQHSQELHLATHKLLAHFTTTRLAMHTEEGMQPTVSPSPANGNHHCHLLQCHLLPPTVTTIELHSKLQQTTAAT